MPDALTHLLENALQIRSSLLDPAHSGGYRLFNGYLEGCPNLAVDLFGRTLVVYNTAEDPDAAQPQVEAVLAFYRQALPWLRAGLLKTRRGATPAERKGVLLFGDQLDDLLSEHGVWYALDLTLNQDASFYLDTRLLRLWLLEQAGGKRVLNTFAYTGSLGVAARAAGAAQVVQTDRSRKFLDLARRSLALNNLVEGRDELLAGDFFKVSALLRRQDLLFDIVILDPPFFSLSEQGRVDLNRSNLALMNKVRPLVADGGALVAINNALFVSGVEYLQSLQALCGDGFVEIETLLPAPLDFTGNDLTQRGDSPTDPAPFNHSTKIAVMRVQRKDGRR